VRRSISPSRFQKGETSSSGKFDLWWTVKKP
jgi:hypothetical protein